MKISNAPIGKALAAIGASLLIGVSAALGASYGFTVGSAQSTVLGIVFAAAALGGELLKPFALSAGLENLGRWSVFKGLACLALAAVCVIYSLASELSLAAGSRGDLAASREQAASTVRDARADRQRAETELASLAPARPATELQPEIDALKRTPGANNCERVDGATSRRVCAKVADLEVEVGRAKRRAELEAAISNATLRAQPVGPNAAVHDADPLAAALATYAGAAGWTVKAETLLPWLALIPVLFLELGSALSVVVVRSIGSEPVGRSVQARQKLRAGFSRVLTSVARRRPVNGSVPVAHIASPAGAPVFARCTPDDTPMLDRLRGLASSDRIEATQAELGRLLGTSKVTVHRLLHRLAGAGKISLSTSRRGTLVCFA